MEEVYCEFCKRIYGYQIDFDVADTEKDASKSIVCPYCNKENIIIITNGKINIIKFAKQPSDIEESNEND